MSENCRLFLECVQEGFLTQHVRNKTTEKLVLDVVIDAVQNLGRFASSDHDLLYWRMNVSQREDEKNK